MYNKNPSWINQEHFLIFVMSTIVDGWPIEEILVQ